MSKTFKQREWGTLHGISMAASGCGPCSIAAIVANLVKDITPKKVAEWLYSSGDFFSSGTTRAGVTAAFEHYGFDVVGYYKPEHSGGTIWKNAMAKMKSLKGDWWAVFLTVGKVNGAKDNFWTSGGHYLAITDYKDGKLYVRDSGARNNTGYFSPEKLRYDTNVIWIVQKKSGKKTYSGEFPTLPSKGYIGEGDTGTEVKKVQLFLKWYGTYKDRVDGKCLERTVAAIKAFQIAEGETTDLKFGPSCLRKAKAVRK